MVSLVAVGLFRGLRIMRAFIEFQTSSLGRHGYPIEVAWVFEDGRSESYLILPADEWTHWDVDTEAFHGLSRDELVSGGVAAAVVARRLVEALRGHRVFAGARSWVGKWLGLLLRAGGLSADAIKVGDTDEALLELASALLAPLLPSSDIHRAARKIVAYAGDRFVGRIPAHRALPDAQFERERWLIVSELAHAYGGRAASQPLFWRDGRDRLHQRRALVHARPPHSANAGTEWRRDDSSRPFTHGR
jgi:hypothetical protein